MHLPQPRKVWCYPVLFALPCPRLPPVEFILDKEQTVLRYKGDAVRINNLHFQKLVRYRLHFFPEFFCFFFSVDLIFPKYLDLDSFLYTFTSFTSVKPSFF